MAYVSATGVDVVRVRWNLGKSAGIQVLQPPESSHTSGYG